MGGWMGVSLSLCVCKICEMNDITIIEHKRSQCSNMISHIPFCFRISHIDARQCVRWVFLFLHTIHPRFLYVTINQIEYFSLWFFVLVQAADAAAAAQIKFVTRCAGEWKLSLRARESERERERGQLLFMLNWNTAYCLHTVHQLCISICHIHGITFARQLKIYANVITQLPQCKLNF